ncbi:MAG: hypothetical protein WCW61_04370 [Patescibacteria group bacterium]|jgi:hypothetical protein
MKIVICGSMKLSKKMIDAKTKLEALGHELILPRHTEEYAAMNTSDHIHSESVKNKVNNDLIRGYYHKIADSDAILVINDTLNDIDGYIGGNAFLEMGFAFVLNKTIYLLNNIPALGYRDELEAMQPIVINNDYSKIK